MTFSKICCAIAYSIKWLICQFFHSHPPSTIITSRGSDCLEEEIGSLVLMLVNGCHKTFMPVVD